MSSSFLDAVKERIIVFDGAMGSNIQNHNLSPDDFEGKDGCNELLVASRPNVIESIHSSFFDVGCDVVETDTFGSTPIMLGEYDIADRAYELNFKAAQLARKVANDYSTKSRPRWVFLRPNGWKTRCVGISRFIPMTRCAGVSRPPKCSFPAGPCDPPIASLLATERPFGFNARRR